MLYSIADSVKPILEMEDIEVGTDNVGNIICILFHSVKNRITEELSPEEREIHKKKSKERSERLLHWFKSNYS